MSLAFLNFYRPESHISPRVWTVKLNSQDNIDSECWQDSICITYIHLKLCHSLKNIQFRVTLCVIYPWRDYTVRGQFNVWRLPKYCPPPPHRPASVYLPPAFGAGGGGTLYMQVLCEFTYLLAMLWDERLQIYEFNAESWGQPHRQPLLPSELS